MCGADSRLSALGRFGALRPEHSHPGLRYQQRLRRFGFYHSRSRATQRTLARKIAICLRLEVFGLPGLKSDVLQQTIPIQRNHLRESPHISVTSRDIEASRWDVIVIGSGVGGATVGRSLALQGLSVLFLEKGGDISNGGTLADGSSAEDRLAQGW